MYKKKPEVRIIYATVAVFFMMFLFVPLAILLINSFKSGNGVGISNYISVIKDKDILNSIVNSIKVSGITAIITTFVAFVLAYGVNCTNIFKRLKGFIKVGISIPMLLPTITYGFAIIYSFGKQGLITRILGREIIQIYGFNGLLLGYIIYTLPAAFLLINNSFEYIDKKFIVVSRLMGDGVIRGSINTVIRPMVGTIGGAFVISFILSFTDFGIPASVGGSYSVVSTYLYEIMLGAIPNFGGGAVIAIFMLLPAVFGVILLNYLERFNFHYDKSSKVELAKNRLRDILFGSLSTLIVIGIMSVLIVMFIAPFVNNYPYDMSFTSKFFKETIFSTGISSVYKNSFMVAFISSITGTVISYAAALINLRTNLGKKSKATIDIFSMIANTVPGMVLGLSYLLAFKGSNLKGTFLIIILCNIVHFFTTPYLMAKNSLSKMNPAWETTGELLGDTWIKTIFRVVIPSSISTIVEMISYYFINSMVTISAIVFLVTARTAVITSKIKELQHFGNFNEIFVLSILIFGTNLIVKILCDFANKKLSDH